MLHRVSRRAAIARAKAASRLAEANPSLAELQRIAVARWEDARRDHGDDPRILRGLANALLLAADETGEAGLVHRALPVLDRLDSLAPGDPRHALLRALALAALGEGARSADRLREALRHFERARAAPGTVPPFVALVLTAEAEARHDLAALTRDPRDARRARETLDRLRAYAPDVAREIGGGAD